MTLFWPLLAIVLLFFILLGVKSRLPWKICAICLAISLTWLALLFAYYTDRFDNILLLALLMGQSIAGIYYLWERRAPKDWLIFRLPLLLSLLYLFYVIIDLTLYWQPLVLLAVLWFSSYMLFLQRTKPSFKRTFDKIIACCSNW